MTTAPRHRQQFDAARDPYGSRNALGITTWVAVDTSAPRGKQYGGAYELTAGTGITFTIGADKKVTINGTGGGIADAPSDGHTYGRLNAAWTGIDTVYAPLASPTFTGDPKAPTPALSDNDTSIATTAFVKNQGYATVSSPVFTGDPQAPTPATADNDTSIATTAFVKAQGYLIANQTVTLSGDVTGSGATAITTTIANNAVTNAKLADMASARIRGRISGGTGDPEDLTGTQATSLLVAFTSISNGVVPSSGGGTANFLRADGTWAAPAAGSGFTTVVIQKFTASGTYTPTASMKFCIIECIGGGAGGGAARGIAAQFFTGGGGGSGAYSRKLASAATIGASQSITIGAGGSGGLMSGAGVGSTGGTTSVGSICTAVGGSGGDYCSSALTHYGIGGAGGGTGGTGDALFAGIPGGNGIFSPTSVVAASGQGGSSAFGGGAVGVYASGAATAGNAAGNYGSGGSGGAASNIAADAAGGAGSSGIVIITEFI